MGYDPKKMALDGYLFLQTDHTSGQVFTKFQLANFNFESCSSSAMEASSSSPVKRRNSQKDGAEHEEIESLERTAKRRKNSNSGYYCAVPCCSNRSKLNPSLSFHRFPTNEQRQKEWIVAIRRDVGHGKDFSITGNTRVCGSHFKETDFATTTSINTLPVHKRLQQTAIPSVFSWSSGEKKPRRTLVRGGGPGDSGKYGSGVLPSATATATKPASPDTLEKKRRDAVVVVDEDAPTTGADSGALGPPLFTPAPGHDHPYCVRTDIGTYLNEVLVEASSL